MHFTCSFIEIQFDPAVNLSRCDSNKNQVKFGINQCGAKSHGTRHAEQSRNIIGRRGTGDERLSDVVQICRAVLQSNLKVPAK